MSRLPPCLLVLALSFGLQGCDGGGVSAAPRLRVIGPWELRQVDEAVVGVPVRVVFKNDGTYRVDGPCHSSVGQYSLTDRGASLQPLELLEQRDCTDAGQALTRTARAAFRECTRVGLSEERGLEFFDRSGRRRLLLERVEQEVHDGG